MPKPDTSPLRINGKILVDGIQRNLDAARARYRKRYDKGYVLSMTGRNEEAQRVLDAANKVLLEAEREYERARSR